MAPQVYIVYIYQTGAITAKCTTYLCCWLTGVLIETDRLLSCESTDRDGESVEPARTSTPPDTGVFCDCGATHSNVTQVTTVCAMPLSTTPSLSILFLVNKINMPYKISLST